MAKLKIGTRVRDDDGDEGVIVGKSKGYRDVKYETGLCSGKTIDLPKTFFTPIPANDNVPATEDARPAIFENEYKVGDRVRLAAKGFAAEVGALATVVSYFDGTFIDVKWDRDGKDNLQSDGKYFSDSFEPVVAPATTATTPAEWVPAVGDRVVVIDADGGGAIGDEGEITKVKVYDDGSGYVFCEISGLSNNLTGLYSYRLAPLPVAEQPAGESGEVVPVGTWSPVEGKFGKTRGGRKVGPAVAGTFGQAWRMKDSTEHADRGYNADGSWMSVDYPSRHDLIAEWVEPAVEPAVEPPVVVAEATATQRMRGQGEPGLTVRCDEWDGELFTAGRQYTFDFNGEVTADDGSKFAGIFAGSFSIVTPEPAAPPAKFKVGDRVNYLLTDTAWQNVAITKVTTEKNGKHRYQAHDSRLADGLFEEDWLELATPPPTHPAIGATVTFTATGRLSAINDNGHMQVTFPDLAPAQNSFALPAKYVALAN